MNRGVEKRARREGKPRRVREWEKNLVELRKTKIGPIFPEADPNATRGNRGVERRKTKRPFGPYVRLRKRRTAVTITCLFCSWTAKGSTWRPTKRLMTAHMAKRHKREAARPS